MSTQLWPIAIPAKSTRVIPARTAKLPQVAVVKASGLTTAAASGHDTLTETSDAALTGIWLSRGPVVINCRTAPLDVFLAPRGDLVTVAGAIEFDVDVISEPDESLVIMGRIGSGDTLQEAPRVRDLTATAASSGCDTSDPVTVESTCIPDAPKKGKVEWLQGTMGRITRFMSLKRNWDSYGGAPISMLAIGRAFTIAMRLADVVAQSNVQLSSAPFVAPTSDGGVVFEIKNGPRELHITVSPTADSYDVYRIDDASGEESETPAKESELPEALSWISRTV